MNILCITHADFETPGVIERWAKLSGHAFTILKPYQGDTLEDVAFDCLIVMGGPQSPLKIEQFPYLADEIALIQEAVKQNKHILGFCLGAQLIGEALGGTTAQSPEKEVGVFPITLTAEGKTDPLLEDLPSSFPVIHWHNDMPGLTQEACLLAFSEGCPRQIIRYGSKIYGFQCHLEITLEGIKEMIAACSEDLAPSKYTQDTGTLLNQNYHAIHKTMINILDCFITL